MSNFLPTFVHEETTMVADPGTGEAFPLTQAPPAVIARAAAYLDDLTGDARRARAALGDELNARLGVDKRMDVGSHKVERDSKNEWLRDDTWSALSALCELGLVTCKQIDDLMPEVPIRKPDGRALNSLLTGLLGVAGEAKPDALEAIRALARARDTKTYIRVKAVSVNGTAVQQV